MPLTQKRLLAAAIKNLKIDRPILRSKVQGNTIILWIYGDTEPVKYTHRVRKTKRRTA